MFNIAKRVLVFLAINFLILFTLSIIIRFTGLEAYIAKLGMKNISLFIICLLWGMGGALLSLALSRFMAKTMYGVELIDDNSTQTAIRVKNTVYRLAQDAGIQVMPEVGIYDSMDPNAFATGPTKNRALVAVSTGLLDNMSWDEIEGVLGHEVAHIANGDMVTMTLIQGIMNAFVMFLARILASIIMSAMKKDDDEKQSFGDYMIYHMVVSVLEMVFMFLSMFVITAFSRYREYKADIGGAKLAGRHKMIAALKKLKQISERARNYHKQEESAQEQVAMMQISNMNKIMYLLSTHPPLEERIARLENFY